MVNRDLRDPRELGERLLHLTGWFGSVREAYDKFRPHVPNYSSNLGPIEKYGRPQDLPSTLPN